MVYKKTPRHNIESDEARYLAALREIYDATDSKRVRDIIDGATSSTETLPPPSIGNNVLEFSISGKPQPQLRPRVTKRGGFVKLYDEHKCVKEKLRVASIAERAHHGNTPINTPIHIDITFRMPVPKGAVKTTRLGSPHVKKPDIDNLVKLVLDGITKSGRVWFDDNQVCAISARKIYSELVGTDVVIKY